MKDLMWNKINSSIPHGIEQTNLLNQTNQATQHTQIVQHTANGIGKTLLKLKLLIASPAKLAITIVSSALIIGTSTILIIDNNKDNIQNGNSNSIQSKIQDTKDSEIINTYTQPGEQIITPENKNQVLLEKETLNDEKNIKNQTTETSVLKQTNNFENTDNANLINSEIETANFEQKNTDINNQVGKQNSTSLNEITEINTVVDSNKEKTKVIIKEQIIIRDTIVETIVKRRKKTRR